MHPCTENAIDDLHKIWIHPNVREFLWDDVIISHEQTVKAMRDSMKSFERAGSGLWTVHLKEKAKIIGFCGLGHYGRQPEIEILYGLDPQCWGKGFATEAATAMLRYGFEELGCAFILGGADPPNEASFRVIEKLGMTYMKRVQVEGLEGKQIEIVYYGIARKDFQPRDSHYKFSKTFNSQ